MADDRYFTIELEDLLAGAFISINLNQNRFVSYKALDEYEHKIGEKLTKEGHRYRFDMSREKTYNVLYYNDKYFEEITINGLKGILLKDSITKDEIMEKFTGYLGLPVLIALKDKDCTKVFDADPKIQFG